ncbi:MULTISPECIES: pentapeptide repeat-containing protein [unclassified Leuconostoc]|uniref:pentapeptide repeat-containing protein n=1 Tax=unclassified Leuconostoc TaxID=2685106 RepID=UPI001908C85C|nr:MULTISPECIES: pentapeptide repeat-containing protein [unclassified Leuconostoc]MBK0040912.1 pentapeptide repeat-containing protein [Leuconostoc sp. S51]MBK0051461.1 pentapeptide repeat-containing protein [Leuconostoc sp. S50]
MQEMSFDEIESGMTYEDTIFSSSQFNNQVDEVTFKNCIFTQDSFKKYEFLDCQFNGIDFSNKNMENCVIYRSSFNKCKLVGTSLINSTLKDVLFKNSKIDFSNFSGSKLSNCSVNNSDCNDVYFIEVIFKGKFFCQQSTLNRCNFSETNLQGVDISESTFDTIVVQPERVKGLKINHTQAAQLIPLLGVIIK